MIGRLHLAGVGVPRDLRVAEEWFRRASAQKHGRSALLYARLKAETAPAGTVDGRTKTPPPETSEDDQVERAPVSVVAALSAPPAPPAATPIDLLEAGLAAYRAEDFTAAAAAWRPLAERGAARAQFHLGGLYMEGRGVARDNVAAYAWLKRALDRGYSPEQALLKQLTSRMTPDQIMAALEKGAE